MSARARSAFVRAQAKINLFLRVGDRDRSGYHDLETLFLRIDLADDIMVRVGESERVLECDGPAVPADGLGPVEKNLAFRAALAYADRAGWPDGFRLHLHKSIPVGGGLGGGSADAGAVLRALDALNTRPLGEAARMELARDLGADVPFMASDRVAAFASGRGDMLRPGDRFALAARPVLLVIPGFPVATSDAYRWLDESRVGAEQGHSRPPDVGTWTWESVQQLLDAGLGNDFERVVEARHAELRQYREWLRSVGARIARLSGSGSTVFGVFDGSLPQSPGPSGAVITATRTSERVVQVDVRE